MNFTFHISEVVDPGKEGFPTLHNQISDVFQIPKFNDFLQKVATELVEDKRS
jgi:hypothetical protein